MKILKFFWLRLIILIIIAGLVGFAAHIYLGMREASITTFQECAKYYPVLESYPEQCNTPGGKHFVNEIKK